MKKPLIFIAFLVILNFFRGNFVFAFFLLFIMMFLVVIRILRVLGRLNQKHLQGEDQGSSVEMNSGEMSDEEKLSETMKSIRKAKQEMMRTAGIVDPSMEGMSRPADDSGKSITVNEPPFTKEKKDDEVPFVFKSPTADTPSSVNASASGSSPSSVDTTPSVDITPSVETASPADKSSSSNTPSSDNATPFGTGSPFGSQDSFSAQDTFNSKDTFESHL